MRTATGQKENHSKQHGYNLNTKEATRTTIEGKLDKSGSFIS